MGVLGQALEALKSILLLQEEVKRLGSNVAKLADHVDDIRTKVIAIDVHQRDAVTLAQQAATITVATELGGIRDRLTKIELYLTTSGPGPAPQILIPPQITRDGALGSKNSGDSTS